MLSIGSLITSQYLLVSTRALFGLMKSLKPELKLPNVKYSRFPCACTAIHIIKCLIISFTSVFNFYEVKSHSWRLEDVRSDSVLPRIFRSYLDGQEIARLHRNLRFVAVFIKLDSFLG